MSWCVGKRFLLTLGTALVVTATSAPAARAGDPCALLPPIDGRNLPTKFANGAVTTQVSPTKFGDARDASTADAQGSEADQLFITYDATNIHLGVTGNLPRTDDPVLKNSMIILLDTNTSTTTNVLATSALTGGSGALVGMNGVTLDSGMTPEYAIEAWNEAGVQFAVLHNLITPGAATSLASGTQYAVNNTNLAGVNAEAADDPVTQTDNAKTATSGYQFRLTRALVGIPAGNPTIRVQALIANGSGFISNQNLPPLNPTMMGAGGEVPCVGIHQPDSMLPDFNVVDFDANFTGSQFVSFTLTGTTGFPALSGTDIITKFGGQANARATQNNFTCFGDASPFINPLAEGSELDELYVAADDTNLYIGITGNTPINDGNQNTVLVFIQTGPGDRVPIQPAPNFLVTSLLTNASLALRNLDGLRFDGDPNDPFVSGFRPDWCVQFWRENNANRCELQDLINFNDLELTFSLNPTVHQLVGDAYYTNLRNTMGVNNIAGDDPLPQTQKAMSATTGYQFSLNLGTLGLTEGLSEVKVLAFIASGGGFVSNQFLPVLRPTDGTLNASETFTTNLPLALIDDNVISSQQALTTAGALSRITDLNVSVNITHPAMQELTISLRHDPSNTTVVLWDGSTNGSGANMNTTFDQDSANDLTSWVAPGVGTFRAHQSLDTFNNLDPNAGNWSLIVDDNVPGNTGTLNSWSLALQEDIGGGVPCIGQHDAFTPIDLNSNFSGDQFTMIDLSEGSLTPTTFTGEDIPGEFGPSKLRATQNNHTCFGDAIVAPGNVLPGSELDQMFILNDLDRLRIGITGNLENNGNAYILLLDVNTSAGLSTITGHLNQPPPALGGFSLAQPGLNGLTFDPGFAPDYAYTVQRETTAGIPTDFYNVWFSNLNDASTNWTRKVGSLVRCSDTSCSGFLEAPIPNQNGSEIDQLFMQADANNIYIGLTGNLEANNNHWQIFLEVVEVGGGSNVLSTDVNGFFTALRGMSGTTMETGFAPNYAIAMNRNGGNYAAQLANLVAQTTTGLTFANTGLGNTFFGTNINAAGVSSNPGDDDAMNPAASIQATVNAPSAQAGVQFTIARAALGSPSNNSVIRVMAAVTSNGFGAPAHTNVSNQLLPGIGGTLGNLGDAPLDLNNGTIAPGTQYAEFMIPTTPSAPLSFSGSNVRDANNNGTLLATQDNYTGYGNATLPAGSGNTNCLQVAFDNTNQQGVSDISATQAMPAETGMEFDIPFSEIGLTPLPPLGSGAFVTVKALVILTGNSGFLSNHTLPPMNRGNQGNVGFIPDPADPPPNGINFGDNTPVTGFPGEQFLAYTLQVPHDPADINGDGLVNAADVTDFVNVLLLTNMTQPDLDNSAQLAAPSMTADADDLQVFVDAYIN